MKKKKAQNGGVPIQVWMKKKDADTLRKEAKDHGMSLAGYIRFVLLHPSAMGNENLVSLKG